MPLNKVQQAQSDWKKYFKTKEDADLYALNNSE